MENNLGRFETKIVFYKSQSDLQSGISKMQKHGWEVVSSENIMGDYGCAKTTCLGCMFLPMALLGKKKGQFKVQYRKQIVAIV